MSPWMAPVIPLLPSLMPLMVLSIWGGRGSRSLLLLTSGINGDKHQ